jgi:hypothetical protein
MSNSVVVIRLTKISRESASNSNNPLDAKLRFNLNSSKWNKFYVPLEIEEVDSYRFGRLQQASQKLLTYVGQVAHATPFSSEEKGKELFRTRSYALVVELHSRGSVRFLALSDYFLSTEAQIVAARANICCFTMDLASVLEEDRLDADYYLGHVQEQWQFVTACYHDYT